jgi:hypothetical protein
MCVLLRATVHAVWQPPVRRLARKLLNARALPEKWGVRALAQGRDIVRHGAAVHPCRLHVVWRNA